LFKIGNVKTENMAFFIEFRKLLITVHNHMPSNALRMDDACKQNCNFLKIPSILKGLTLWTLLAIFTNFANLLKFPQGDGYHKVKPFYSGRIASKLMAKHTSLLTKNTAFEHKFHFPYQKNTLFGQKPRI
jgi:hypothetical protein